MFMKSTAYLLAFVACVAVLAAEKPVPIIFDTDIGTDVDDAYALVLAARSPQIDLRGVTTLYGHVALRSALARKLLLLTGKDRIPVASGEPKPIDGHQTFWGGWEGKGVIASNETVQGILDKPAWELIAELLAASSERITIVSVGGLSNVAAALQRALSIRSKIERIVIMGGCVRPLLIQDRKIPPRLETNLHNDIDAAGLVFQSNVPITLVPAEVTFKTKLFFRDFELVEKSPSPLAKAITTLTQEWEPRLRGFMKSFGVESYYTDGTVMLHDPLAVCLLVDPTVATLERVTIRLEIGADAAGKREFRTRIDVELERGFSPFVRRQKELDLLRERLAEAKTGRGQIVFEMGEPGVGKSRLLYEFRRSLEGESFLWLTGRCISFGSHMPYLPVVDFLKRYLRIEEHDDELAVIQKCEQAVAALGEEIRPAIPYLKGLLSMNPGDEVVAKMDAQVRRMKTFEALRALLLKLAETKPLVLVVEDLHWMDKASEEMLIYLADSIATAPVLMILTYRPGYANSFGDRTYATRQALNRLSDPESLRLAEGMLGAPHFPVELRGLITSKAEGNPFSVEEVIKSLLEMGALQRQNGHYVATKAVAEIHVPDTIQDVIAARIDRLEDSAKQALQLASVIGREFTVSLLGRISDLKDQLGKLLQDLKVLELIYERSLFPELAYMFKHALTQDVAYNTLLIQRRKDLHRMVAMAIEELYAERLAEFYEMLAYHYEKAEVWEKALQLAYEERERDLAFLRFYPLFDRLRAEPRFQELLKKMGLEP
jgi:inosine-uridine nucleoside N-ribohydrolase